MTDRTKLSIAWDVDVPSSGFADRVVSRALAADDVAVERTRRNWRSRSRPVSIPIAVVVAAAAALLLYVGASPGSGEPRSLDSAERAPAAEHGAELGVVSNGGNTAINPEAGANGVW